MEGWEFTGLCFCLNEISEVFVPCKNLSMALVVALHSCEPSPHVGWHPRSLRSGKTMLFYGQRPNTRIGT